MEARFQHPASQCGLHAPTWLLGMGAASRHMSFGIVDRWEAKRLGELGVGG